MILLTYEIYQEYHEYVVLSYGKDIHPLSIIIPYIWTPLQPRITVPEGYFEDGIDIVGGGLDHYGVLVVRWEAKKDKAPKVM